MKLLIAICLFACSVFAQTTTVHPGAVTPLATNAQHPVWCKANCGLNVIAYEQEIPGSGGIYEIWSMDQNGGNQTCLSCTNYAKATLPALECGALLTTRCQQGNPEWAPNGDIVFQQERAGCRLTSAEATPGTGLCADLVECDPNFATSCAVIASSGTASESGFLQYRFSADGTKLFGGHVIALSGTCTAIFGEALSIRIFEWKSSPPTATQIVYSGTNTVEGDLLPAPFMPGNTCDTAFVEGATTYPTSIEPTTKTLFFSMVGNTTQAFRQYSMDISSGNADTILGTMKVVSAGGVEWSEMGKIDPTGTHLAYVTSTCTPYTPPSKIANVALDLAIQSPIVGGSKVCATTYNTPGGALYYYEGSHVQVEYFDWGPADGIHNDTIIANVSDNLTINNIYMYSLVGLQLGPPLLTSAANAGAFQAVFASGEYVSLFGLNLAPDTRVWGSSDFHGSNLPTSLDDVSVMIDGIPAYVYYISPTQVNVIAPDDAHTGSVPIQITSSGQTSQTFMLNKQAFAPAFFIFPPEGSKYIVATHANNTLVGNTGLYPGLSTPAVAGEIITLWGTGFGATNPATPSGMLVSAPAVLANTVTVTIGGIPATVEYAGLVESGLNQINVMVPQGVSGDELVVATVGGVPSEPGAYITTAP